MTGEEKPSKTLRFVLWVVIGVGLLAVRYFAEYGVGYVMDRENTLRHEYLVGMGFFGVYLGLFWVAAPVLAFALRSGLSRAEVVLAALPISIAFTVTVMVAALG